MTIYDVIRALISGGFPSEEAKAEALTAVDTWEHAADQASSAKVPDVASLPASPPAEPIAAEPSASFTTVTEPPADTTPTPPAEPVPPTPLIPNGEANPDAEDAAEGPEPTP